MNRSTILTMLCAAALLVASTGDAEAREVRREKARVKGQPARVLKGKQVRGHRQRSYRGRRVKAPGKYRSATRKATLARKATTVRKRRPVKTARKRQLTRKRARYTVNRSRRVVRIKVAISRLPRKQQAAAMKLIASHRVRTNRSARALVAEYLRLASRKGGASVGLSISDIKGMTRGGRWSTARMANLAKVLRLANYLAKKQKISPKAAFNKALKAAGVYKKYHSNKCGV